MDGWNYSLVVGQDEKTNDTVAIRKRDEEKETRGVKVDDAITMFLKEMDDKTWFPPAVAANDTPAKAAGGKGAAKGGKAPKGGKGAAQGATTEGGGEESAFTKIDLRVGQIVKAWEHPDSDKLWCEHVDVGEDKPRQIASGLRAHYSQEEMTNRRILVVCNLKAAKLGGFESQGMVLCAKTDDKVEFVDVPEGAKVGERVFVDGCSGSPAGPGLVKKKKLWEALQKDLKTDDKKVAAWTGKALMTSAGPCTSPSLTNAPIC